MKQEVITKGNRAVVISVQENVVWANLYVNARNGIHFDAWLASETDAVRATAVRKFLEAAQ